MCLITGCIHTISRRGKMGINNGNTWGRWQICPCCARVLLEMKVIEYDKRVDSSRCKKMIENEFGKKI